MNSSIISSKFKNFLIAIGGIGISQDDNPEVRSHKIILTVAIYASILNLLVFSYAYSTMGRSGAALTLLVFAVYLTISLLAFRFHRKFKILRDSLFIGWYFYLIIYHVVMGGYIGSVLYINYVFAILSGVPMFYKRKVDRVVWYCVYIVTAIVLFVLEPVISKGMVPLPDDLILLTHVNNFVLIASMIFLSINYYTNIIQTEKLKSDTLIHNILPKSVVNELNTQGRSRPIMVPRATAIFMDFVGFTRITQTMGPEELVAILNEHFTSFDHIFQEHGVEKLKTIGDGYMAVGGLPIQNNTHPVDVALAAMKVVRYMQAKNSEHHMEWNIRIGIHTGPMVAGIIGETKFSYDVWGSTVNLCSRLETASKPGGINVSYEFMECTQAFFEFEPRGQIEVKNAGSVSMYFLTDIKEALRTDHFTPNSRFFELYEKYALHPDHKPVLETII